MLLQSFSVLLITVMRITSWMAIGCGSLLFSTTQTTHMCSYLEDGMTQFRWLNKSFIFFLQFSNETVYYWLFRWDKLMYPRNQFQVATPHPNQLSFCHIKTLRLSSVVVYLVLQGHHEQDHLSPLYICGN